MTTEVTHQQEESLHLLVERQWLRDMAARFEELIRRFEAKNDELEALLARLPERGQRGGRDA